MTGDGVNDAPALKDAGIGSRWAREAPRDLADVVLLDDNFSSIVGAVEQGRTIYSNIRKALKFCWRRTMSLRPARPASR